MKNGFYFDSEWIQSDGIFLIKIASQKIPSRKGIRDDMHLQKDDGKWKPSSSEWQFKANHYSDRKGGKGQRVYTVHIVQE